MQSSFTPPRLCLLTVNPMLSLRLQLLPVPSQESRQCHMPMFTLCTLSSAPRFYCYSIPYVNTVIRTGHPRVLCSDSMASSWIS